MITTNNASAPGSDPAAAVARAAPPPTPVVGAAAPEKAPPPPKVNFDPEKMMANIREAVEHLNKQMASSGRTLGFSLDSVLKTPVVTVKDSRSGEVIRQIPSEAVIKAAHTIEELKGVLYDQST